MTSRNQRDQRQSFAFALQDEQGMYRVTYEQTVVIQAIVSDK